GAATGGRPAEKRRAWPRTMWQRLAEKFSRPRSLNSETRGHSRHRLAKKRRERKRKALCFQRFGLIPSKVGRRIRSQNPFREGAVSEEQGMRLWLRRGDRGAASETIRR